MNTDQVMDSCKFWTAAEFKSLQTKLTKLENGIKRDALSPRLRRHLSLEDIATLEKASNALANVKRTVEHAKEVKLREERKREALLAKQKKQRLALLEKYLPLAVEPAQYLDTILLSLAMGLYFRNQHPGAYVPENHYRVTDINRALDKNHHYTLKHVVANLRREVRQTLDEYLWPYNQTPEETEISTLLQTFADGWKAKVSAIYQTDLELVRAEVAANAFVANCKAVANTA